MNKECYFVTREHTRIIQLQLTGSVGDKAEKLSSLGANEVTGPPWTSATVFFFPPSNFSNCLATDS